MSKTVCVLDACALIALQRGEPGADSVVAELGNTEQVVLLHAVNLCEVYYDALRREPAIPLADLWRDVVSLGIVIETNCPAELIARAGAHKAYWRRISLADCIALALAEIRGGALITTDHHEFDPLAAAGHPIRFVR